MNDRPNTSRRSSASGSSGSRPSQRRSGASQRSNTSASSGLNRRVEEASRTSRRQTVSRFSENDTDLHGFSNLQPPSHQSSSRSSRERTGRGTTRTTHSNRASSSRPRAGTTQARVSSAARQRAAESRTSTGRSTYGQSSTRASAGRTQSSRTTSARSARPSQREATRFSQPATRRAPQENWERSLDPRKAGKPPKIAERGTQLKIASIIAIVIVLLIVIYAVRSFVFAGGELFSSNTAAESSSSSTSTVLPTVVSFVAVGDNLPEIEIGNYADSLAGTTGDGNYDYTPIYSNVQSYIQDADLAYIDEEVHCGGNSIGPRGWPSFNVTDQMADALVAVGFDMVASATNHAYDWGSSAVKNSRSVWNTKDVAFTGTATSQEECDTIVTVTRNGMTFSLLNYTYGVNSYTQDELNEPYEVNFIDEERIRSDVARAHEISEVVIVAMHWGTENSLGIDETQAYYSQLLADLDVDLIVGSHPHVIGPVEWLTGQDGHKTLCAYSLGNFISNHDVPGPENELEGMLSCDFVRSANGTVTIENAVWTPLVNHDEAGNFSVYPLKDYTYALAQKNKGLSSLEDPITWLKNTTYNTVTTIEIND